MQSLFSYQSVLLGMRGTGKKKKKKDFLTCLSEVVYHITVLILVSVYFHVFETNISNTFAVSFCTF